MSLYLPVRTKGSAAIAICGRCQQKVYYDQLTQDPNNHNWYCPECVDIYDPWRLAARKAEDISLQHPRPDTAVSDESDVIAAESGVALDFPPEISV